MKPLELAALGFASYRLTRLIVDDTIWEESRAKLLSALANVEHNDDDERKKLAAAKGQELLGCPFCVGVWASAFVLAASRSRAGRALVDLFAIAGVQAMLAALEPE
jgi:hypothetical protein